MTEAPKLLQCYNKGCSQLYEEAKNHADACVFHPGDPFFHDAYKGWSCCKKKCTDFTEFLNIKGCTKSFHNNVKPFEPEKPAVDKSKKDEVIEYMPPKLKTTERLPRPSDDAPLSPLNVTISASLEQHLEKLKIKQDDKGSSKSTVSGMATVTIGTSCKNGGCRKTFEGEGSDTETCIYHSGVPIFHEGLKYWTCCLKKTTDFNSFLEQVGCVTGKHLWIKDDSTDKKRDCRYDWHQTGSFVVISFYTKAVVPDKCHVELNPVKMHVYLTYGTGIEPIIYDQAFVLREIVDVEKSSVVMSATKVEVKLKKAEPITWQKLSLNLDV